MSNIVTEQIDRLRLEPLRRPLGWRLTFRSRNDGLVHQLYINGRLADATDTAAQRSFEISAHRWTQELAVAAVPAERRYEDHFADLPAEVASPSWVYRPAMLRDVRHRPGDRLAVFHDSATGTMNDTPATTREVWPAGVPHWGWGCGQLGRGGFGIDADRAPGFGAGPFGAGPMGVDVDRMDITLPLLAGGTHTIELRTLTAEGRPSEYIEETFTPRPPPAPLQAVAATNYNPNTQTLSVNLFEES